MAAGIAARCQARPWSLVRYSALLNMPPPSQPMCPPGSNSTGPSAGSRPRGALAIRCQLRPPSLVMNRPSLGAVGMVWVSQPSEGVRN